MPAKPKNFLTSREAASLLGVALSTVQLWTESGVLHAWKTGGGHRRIARQSVEALLKEQRAAVQKATGSGLLKVVVVEDDPGQRKLYRRQFAIRELPIQLTTASNGFEGLVQIGRNLPDVIITDLLMPGMDGFEMIRSLKKMPELEATLTLVVSALTEEEIKARGDILAEVSVFQKPVSFDILETILRARIEEKLAS